MLRFLKENIIFVLSSVVVAGLITSVPSVVKKEVLNKEDIPQSPIDRPILNGQDIVQNPVQTNIINPPVKTPVIIKKNILVSTTSSTVRSQIRNRTEGERDDD